jgi:hypothetical protein
MAIAGSLFVVLAHHLGYVESRSRNGCPKLFALLIGSLQAVALNPVPSHPLGS